MSDLTLKTNLEKDFYSRNNDTIFNGLSRSLLWARNIALGETLTVSRFPLSEKLLLLPEASLEGEVQ